MLQILNLLPFNFISKHLFYISSAFSIIYFVMALGEFIHIIYNAFWPNYDWQEHTAKNDLTMKSRRFTAPGPLLIMLTILNFVLALLMVLVFPLFHL